MLVFLAILLVALVTGVTIYKNVANIQLSTDEGRLGKQLIGNTVRARDGSERRPASAWAPKAPPSCSWSTSTRAPMRPVSTS